MNCLMRNNAILDAHAIALPPNEVVLCPSFWRLPLFLQAGVILHEMFQLRFDPCFTHGPCERKQTSAYKRFIDPMLKHEIAATKKLLRELEKLRYAEVAKSKEEQRGA